MIKKYITKHQLIYDVLKCPKDIVIPVNDIDAWLFFPKYNWIYNKITICQTQKIPCAPIGITPPNFPGQCAFKDIQQKTVCLIIGKLNQRFLYLHFY